MLYKDATKPVQQRVEDLLARMTLEEKAAQLACAMTMGANSEEQLRAAMPHGIGTLSFLNMSLSGDLPKDHDNIRAAQQYLVENTRLGIPALIHSEAIAGAQIPGATTFPQSLNLASTWQPELAAAMGETVRGQLRAFGFHATHSPLFDLGRDARWGRIGETYGEDPYLVAQMGTAFVKGLQGENEIMATAKHFVGYAGAEGGRNGGTVEVGERTLLDTCCWPFEAAIREGGVKAVMNSYGILNGEPIATSKYLLTDVLRGKLGFDGLVVSDYGTISRAYQRYRTAKDAKEAAVQALAAGMDVEQPTDTCYRFLCEAVREGTLDEAVLDRSVRRVLGLKFTLGLFEHPYSTGDYKAAFAAPQAAALSQEIAAKSMVLVKNEAEFLPLPKACKIALIGPTADDAVPFFGGYSSVGSANTTSRDFDQSENDNFIQMAYQAMIGEYKHNLTAMGIIFEDEPSPEQKQTILGMLKQMQAKGGNQVYSDAADFVAKYYPQCRSVKAALEEAYGKENVVYVKGCAGTRAIEGGIEAAVEAVRQADIVVAVLGGKESMREPDATCGENRDNLNIGLEQPQLDLMRAVFAQGKPVASVIVDGRPLETAYISENSQAVLYAWLPAQAGAEAIVNVLTGKVNPSGKLPVTIARCAGQLPLYHSRMPLYQEDEVWAEFIHPQHNLPLYHFGHGLSYTNFEYGGLYVQNTVPSNGVAEISFTITNTGKTTGDEIAQVYVKDMHASVARPVKQLAAFARVPLKAGESKTVCVKLDLRQLAFHNAAMRLVVEPGEMQVFVGASSADLRLKGSFAITGEEQTVTTRVFAARVTVE